VYAQKDLIIYVSTNCPHCAKVEEFIAENDLTDKIQIKNVTENQQFAEEYADFVEENEIPTANQGTPTLLFESEDEDDFEWVVGDDPIIEFLGEKYDIEIEETSTNDSGDYLFLAVGMIIVVFVAGYGIVNIVNGKKKN
jgi:glutaredoxin